MVPHKDQLLLFLLYLDNILNAFRDIWRAQDRPKNAQHAHINTHLQVHTHTYTRVCAWAPNEHTWAHIYMHTYLHMWMHVHTHTYAPSTPLSSEILIFLESACSLKTRGKRSKQRKCETGRGTSFMRNVFAISRSGERRRLTPWVHAGFTHPEMTLCELKFTKRPPTTAGIHGRRKGVGLFSFSEEQTQRSKIMSSQNIISEIPSTSRIT